jgi:HK97 family phage major capsid protein
MNLRSEKQILEQRATILAQVEDKFKAVKAEGRNPNADELAFFDKADADVRALTAERDTILQGKALENKMEEYRSMLTETAKVTPTNSAAPKGEADVRSAFSQWMKHGAVSLSQEQRSVLQPLEVRGTSTQVTTTDALGGYLVPEEWANELYKQMSWYGGALEAGKLFKTTAGGPFHKPTVNDTSNTGAIIAQGVADVVSDITHAEIIFQDYTYTSKLIKWSLETIQDSKYDVVSETNAIAAERLGRILNTHFTTGDNSSKPQGLVNGSTLGKTCADDVTFTRAEIVDLIHSVNKSYRGPNCGFMFNDTILATIKKLSFGSSDDRPLWQASIREGEPDRLEGYKYFINNDMATVAAAAKIMLFGDFSKYEIRQISGFNLHRSAERYFEERAVAFFMTCRFDARYLDTAAVKHMITAAS